jgi:hypothetical protein
MKDNRSPFDLIDNNNEVAAELGVTPRSATNIKVKALEKAKALLEKKGYKANHFFEESKDE